nr:probable multidrug resistance-associated protein lethal(2)03659 [Leptinotarsa decemlineata]
MDLIFRLIQPIMLGYLLDYFKPNQTTTTKTDALWYAGAVVALNTISALFINQYIMDAFHYGMKVRAAVCALIYRKALRLSKTALGDTASGKIVNLLSNDVSRFDIVSIFIHHMWVAPTSSIIIMYFLWAEAGYAGILGIIAVFCVVPLQAYTGKLAALYRKQTALKTDERVRMMDEVISGVQVIKLYAWEKPFEKLIELARKAELKVVIKSSYVRALFMTFNLFTTRAALFCTLLTMALTDQEITARKAFVFMSYFNIMSQTMSSMFVRGISEIAELFVSIKRLQGFMNSEEFQGIVNTQNNNDIKFSNTKQPVILRDLTAKWNLASSDTALNNVNLKVNKGSLVGIIGPVGSGKSSLLQAILGELELTSGTIDVNGTISYASQEPWVFAATIRQNILFGSSYDKLRYNDVVRACALEKDFTQFPNGDLTMVGDRGASLSGGQKARINLARAVYRETDIYLFDDPLSAVDIHVSKHLYDECINGYLVGKTRILVTHQVHHLKEADHIIIFNNGIIEKEGTFQDLSESDNLYAKLLTAEPEPTEEERLKQVESAVISRKLSLRSRNSSLSSAVSEISLTEAIIKEHMEENEQEEEEEIKLKDIQEDSSKGKIHGSLFWKYLTSGGNIFFVIFVSFLYITTQVIASGVDYFVRYWVDLEEARNLTFEFNTTEEIKIEPTSPLSTDTCLYIYAGGLVLLFSIALLRSMLFYKLAMFCSQKLHDIMFSSVIDATMRFFDTNPSGRILNRFSKDIGAVDELLPKVILDSGQILLLMVGSLLLVAIVNSYTLILVAIIGVLFLSIRNVYLKTSKNIKRLEGIMRSPAFTHLNATLQGLTTIRSFGAQDILRDEFDKHQDSHTSAWFMYISASSAFGFYLDVLCCVFVAVVTFSFLTFGECKYY